MNDLYSWSLAISGAALGITILYFCYRYFELAAFFVGFSVWVPHIFSQNNIESSIQEEAGISSYIRIGLILSMGAVGLIKFFQYLPRHKGKVPLQFILMALFIVFAFVSISYSLDQNMTFVRAAAFLGLFSFLLGLYSWIREEEHLYKLLNILYKLALFYIALTALVMVFMPGRAWWWFVSSRFIGIWGHPNTAGLFCLTTYPILIWKFNESNTYHKIFISGLLIFVLFIHVMTGSRTSLFASVIGVCIWFILQRKALKSVIALAIIGLAFFILIQVKPGSFDREESKSITDVTGRDEFWTSAIILIKEKPLTGYGYSVKGEVWSDPRFYKEGYNLWSGSSRTSLHDGWLTVAVGLGMGGLLIWVVILLIPLLRVLRLNNPAMTGYKSFALSIMVMMIMANFAESFLDSTASIGAIFFWMGWIIAGKLYEFNKEMHAADHEKTEEVLEESYAL